MSPRSVLTAVALVLGSGAVALAAFNVPVAALAVGGAWAAELAQQDERIRADHEART